MTIEFLHTSRVKRHADGSPVIFRILAHAWLTGFHVDQITSDDGQTHALKDLQARDILPIFDQIQAQIFECDEDLTYPKEVLNDSL